MLYVTERCVFQLTPQGLELVEVAPGIDVERDILALMDFRPLVRDPEADGRAALPGRPMGLETMLLGRPLSERFTLDPAALDAVHRFCRLPRPEDGAGRGSARAGTLDGRAARAARSRR